MRNSSDLGPCFSDLGELDHVCDLIRSDSECIEQGIPIDIRLGPLRVLIDRIEKQKRWHRALSDIRYPGGFDRSFLVAEYDNATWLANYVIWHPTTLPEKLDAIILSMHRVMLFFGDLSEDQLELTASRLASAEKELAMERALLSGAQEEIEALKPHASKWQGRIAAQKKTISGRFDQKQKQALLAAVKKHIESGGEIYNLPGLKKMAWFDPSWNDLNDVTIKRWLNAIGVRLKSGAQSM